MEFTTQLLYPHDEVVLALMIFVIMLGMGSSLTLTDFRAVARQPKGVLIGFLSQFGFMPLLAFTLATTLNFPPAFAIALVLIGCLPGGTTSNMFTYFSRGHVALSVSMTTVSTLAALVMMPILLNLYAGGFTAQVAASLTQNDGTVFKIPTFNIITSLVMVIIPVIMGMLLRYKSPSWAKTIEDTAGFVGVIVVLYLVLTGFIRHTEIFLRTPIEVYIGALGLGFSGFFIGFWFSRALGMYPIFQRAVSLETGIQNGPLAFAIILLSFQEPIQSQMVWIAILYSTFIVVTSSIITLYYRRVGRFDWDVYKNTVVQNRLFGDDFVTRYPEGFLPPRLVKDPSQGTSPSQRRP